MRRTTNLNAIRAASALPDDCAAIAHAYPAPHIELAENQRSPRRPGASEIDHVIAANNVPTTAVVTDTRVATFNLDDSGYRAYRSEAITLRPPRARPVFEAPPQHGDASFGRPRPEASAESASKRPRATIVAPARALVTTRRHDARTGARADRALLTKERGEARIAPGLAASRPRRSSRAIRAYYIEVTLPIRRAPRRPCRRRCTSRRWRTCHRGA